MSNMSIPLMQPPSSNSTFNDKLTLHIYVKVQKVISKHTVFAIIICDDRDDALYNIGDTDTKCRSKGETDKFIIVLAMMMSIAKFQPDNIKFFTSDQKTYKLANKKLTRGRSQCKQLDVLIIQVRSLIYQIRHQKGMSTDIKSFDCSFKLVSSKHKMIKELDPLIRRASGGETINDPLEATERLILTKL